MGAVEAAVLPPAAGAVALEEVAESAGGVRVYVAEASETVAV